MTVSFVKSFPYTIASGSTNGPVCNSIQTYEDMVALVLMAPAVIIETTTIQTNDKPDGTGTWRTLQDDTPNDIAGPAAGKSRFYPQLVNVSAWRLVASGAVAADRVFTVSGQWTT